MYCTSHQTKKNYDSYQYHAPHSTASVTHLEDVLREEAPAEQDDALVVQRDGGVGAVERERLYVVAVVHQRHLLVEHTHADAMPPVNQTANRLMHLSINLAIDILIFYLHNAQTTEA